MSNATMEELAVKMSEMDRGQLVKLLRQMRCGFKMDFTDAYLKAMSVERLRHIILAASLHTR